MQVVKSIDKNIRDLIIVNYQRMVAFEQAAFRTDSNELKEFFAARADDSEKNIQELCECAGIPVPENLTAEVDVAQFSTIFNGRRTMLKILEAAKLVEKIIADWYKVIIRELKNVPQEFAETISNQYKMLTNAQLQLERL